MIIRGATIAQLQSALREWQAEDPGARNVTFRDIRTLNTRGDRVRFTLKVRDSRAEYASVTGRHIPSACWHAHGHYFDYIFAALPDATIRASDPATPTLTVTDHWRDYRRGSMMYPYMASESCDC